jgi:hypothetical protein
MQPSIAPETDKGKYTLKANEQDARERLSAFWRGESFGRPALGITVKDPSFSPLSWEDGELDNALKDISPEYQLLRAKNTLGHLQYHAEAMPGYTVTFGSHIPLLAVLLGGDFEYDLEHEDDCGALARIQPWPEVFDHPVPAFHPDILLAKAIANIIERLADVVGDQGIIAPPSWLDAFSTLACFRTHEQFCLDLLDRPDTVKDWLLGATQFLLDANNYYHQLCKSRGYGESLSWLNLMAEGKMDTLQADSSIMISPEMFREFVAPMLQMQSEDYDFSIYHIEGHDGMAFLDQVCALPGLNAIQYNRIGGSAYPGFCLEDYHLIKLHNISLYVYAESLAEAVEVTRVFGPDGLYIHMPPFNSQNEAEEAIQQIKKAVK